MAFELITKTAFDEEVHACHKELFNEHSPIPVPDSRELEAFATNLCLEPRVTILKDDGRWVGIAICHVQQERLQQLRLKAYRLLGDDAYDYLAILCRPGCLPPLLAGVRQDARRQGADILFFRHVVNLDRSPPLEKYLRWSSTQIFDAAASSQGWQEILSQRDLRRKDNRIRREARYRCEHQVGEYSEQDLDQLMELHIERWTYEGPRSKFENPAARRLLASYPPHDKILTRLYDGDDIVAVHFGMLFSDVLLWHTPVISIKHLRHSPLMQLLLETVRYCEAHGVRQLDLGLGEEPYKQRVSNRMRQFCQLLWPLTPRGMAAYLVFLARKKWGRLLIPIRDSASETRTRLKIRVSQLVHTVRIYQLEADPLVVLDSPNRLGIIREWPALVDLARANRLPIQETHYRRLRDGDSFLYLHDGHQVFSYGWATRKPQIYISEVGRTVDNRGCTMLYDFWTPDHIRGKGHYTELLKHISRGPAGTVLQIYVQSGNAPSRRAIERVGFRLISTH